MENISKWLNMHGDWRTNMLALLCSSCILDRESCWVGVDEFENMVNGAK